MQNCGAILNIDRQPVLPFISPPLMKQLKEISSMPIGTKIKSFQIKRVSSSSTSSNSGATIKLPNFPPTQSFSLDIFTDRVISKSISFYLQGYTYSQRVIPTTEKVTCSTKRFWWHLFLSIGSIILLFPLLLQTSSQARNLLERAKIYLELDSPEAVTIPNSGRAQLQNNQASHFNRAIGQARKIQPYSPFYEDAKLDIIRWSEVILDIAQGRASRGDFNGAIAAAKLIPQDEASVHFIAQQATKSIGHWQLRARQQKINQYALTEAKKLINPTQASSYSQAISVLRQIAPGVQEYQEAQSLIEQWSRQIYLIANYRASKGNYAQAIEAATLVPKDSPYYQGAKNAMIKWRKSMPVEHSWEDSNLLEARMQAYCQCP